MPTLRGDVIHDVNAVARGHGLVPGGRATDAAAAHRDLHVAYADPAREAAGLERLAAWARRWSPATRADGVDGIALDITGCAHLFGGEAAMLDEMAARLGSMDLSVRLAAAPNHAAAHALSRFAVGERPLAVDGNALAEALSPLPVTALRIDAASVTLLRRLGLRTIGDVDRVPRPTLKKRFGSALRRRDPRDDTYEDYLGRSLGASADVLARLDEAMGRVGVPLDPGREVEPPRVVRGLPEPVGDVDVVLGCFRPLVAELMGGLARRDEGVVALGLEAFRVDGGRASSVLRLSRATRETERLMRLLVDRLEGWRAPFGFDALAVEALETAPLPPQQDEEPAGPREGDLHALVDRLRTRLGDTAVTRPCRRESHVPERADTWPTREPAPVPVPEPGAAPARPDRMFAHPEEVAVLYALPEGPPARFTWRRRSHDVARVAGPERIAPEWWRERSHVRARDYFRVETGEGRRLWLFREGFDGDERGAPPRWFVHGLFS